MEKTHMKPTDEKPPETTPAQPVNLTRIVRRLDRVKCFFGHHDWKIVSIGVDGISRLNECTRCGRGQFLQFLGYASTVGKVSRDEMQQWHREARPPNDEARNGPEKQSKTL